MTPITTADAEHIQDTLQNGGFTGTAEDTWGFGVSHKKTNMHESPLQRRDPAPKHQSKAEALGHQFKNHTDVLALC